MVVWINLFLKVKRPNMDRHLSSADRHRGKREHLSESEKRKAAAEKEKKTQEVLAKSRRMTDFFTAPSMAKSDVATTSHSLNDDTASCCASPLQEDDLVSAENCNNMVSAYKIRENFWSEMICRCLYRV